MDRVTTYMNELRLALKTRADPGGFDWPCILEPSNSIIVTPGVHIGPNLRETNRKRARRSSGGGSKLVGVRVYVHGPLPGFEPFQQSVNALHASVAVERLMPILVKLTVRVQEAQAVWEGRITACTQAAEKAGFVTTREMADTRHWPTLQITSADGKLVADLNLTTWRLSLNWAIQDLREEACFDALAKLRDAVQEVMK